MHSVTSVRQNQGTMNKLLFASLFIFLATCFADAQPKTSDLYSVRAQKIKDDIYFIYRPEPLRHFVEGNVMLIVNDKDAILVDGGGSPAAARNIVAEIRKITKKPVRLLINTHPHVDHTLGNEVYVKEYPGVEIISHSATRDDLLTNGPPYVQGVYKEFDAHHKKNSILIDRAMAEKKPGYEKVVAYMERYCNEDSYVRRDEYSRATISAATMIVDTKMVLYRGSRIIQIEFIGHGDTEGDLVVYLPNEKVICTGDMVVAPVPYGFSSEPLQWIETLKRLKEFDFEILMPGHGGIQTDEIYIDALIKLLQDVQAKVQAGVTKGETLETIRQNIDLTEFSNKFFPNDPVADFRFGTWFINPAVQVAYEQLSKNKRK